MRAICRANTGNALNAPALAIGNTNHSEFDIEVGHDYVIFGIVDFRHAIHFLVIGESGVPTWGPVELFTLTVSQLPQKWYFRYVGDEQGIIAIWGYDELVNEPSHYEALIEGDELAIDVFIKRKSDIEH